MISIFCNNNLNYIHITIIAYAWESHLSQRYEEECCQRRSERQDPLWDWWEKSCSRWRLGLTLADKRSRETEESSPGYPWHWSGWCQSWRWPLATLSKLPSWGSWLQGARPSCSSQLTWTRPHRIWGGPWLCGCSQPLIQCEVESVSQSRSSGSSHSLCWPPEAAQLSRSSTDKNIKKYGKSGIFHLICFQ